MKDLDFLHKSFDQQTQNTNLPKVVLVEDDELFGKTLKKYIEKTLNLEVLFFLSPRECIENLPLRLAKKEDQDFESFCLVTDISFQNDSGADGLLLLDLLKEKKFSFISIVMTGFASIETAISATRKGVFHYLTKPFGPEVLVDLIKNALAEKLGISQLQLNQKCSQQSERPNSSQVIVKKNQSSLFSVELPTEDDIFCGMIGRSRVMKQVFERIKRVADSKSTVLIGGPSGTGKELVANAIHQLSARAEKSIISVNCGAIPSELLESELFGHEKGAFTGAISARKGRFELADEGTIFLDEIGDMPLLLQVKLLRVLQNKVIERVGSTVTTPVNVRIITATHRDLEQSVKDGDFREDLFYRLNVIPIKIPSLAKRKEDIPLLIGHFLKRFVSADGRNSIQFDDESLSLLMAYDWPGNVRELENLIERLVILRGGHTIVARDLPPKFLSGKMNVPDLDRLVSLPQEGIDLKKTLHEIEESLIGQALERTEGNKNQASKLLNMNRTTLIEKMKKRGIHSSHPSH